MEYGDLGNWHKDALLPEYINPSANDSILSRASLRDCRLKKDLV